MTMRTNADGNTLEDRVECRHCGHTPSQVLGGTCGGCSARFRCTSDTCGRTFVATLPKIGARL